MSDLEIEQVVRSVIFDEWDEDEVFSKQEIVDALLYDNTVPISKIFCLLITCGIWRNTVNLGLMLGM